MTQVDWTRFDAIVALDEGILRILEESQPTSITPKILLFNAPHGLQDPYLGGRVDFAKMYETIRDGMKDFLVRNELMEPEDFVDEMSM
jgi:protein-tyrosine phosphatase